MFLLIGACALVGVARFCHHATRGFSLTKIQGNLLEGKTEAEPVSADIRAIFEQKFHYLGRGLQSFAFESEDQRYVLKLFNNRYQRKIALFSLLAPLPFVHEWALEHRHYYTEKLRKTYGSYKIASDEMADKTGLIYLHLQATTDLPRELTLVDPLMIQHRIDPNQTGFLIQKKANLVYPTLKAYVEERDWEGAKQAIASLLEIFFWKARHAIADNDPLIRTNYGFIDGKAVQIDVGPLSKLQTAQSTEQQHKEIVRITTSLKYWLNENASELTAFLDQELQQQLSLQE